MNLAKLDFEVFEAISREELRQKEGLELIASENIVSRAVLEAAGSVMTNKYAEGYPGKRYYGGCEEVDKVEVLAIERVKQLFGAEVANVQPHSGSQANMAVYMALMQPGDCLLALDLNAGGHLTHGSPVSFSGRIYHAVHYGLQRDTETIDYAQAAVLAKEHRPKVIVVGGSAYPRFFDFAKFREIADTVGAKLVVDMAHFAGLVAAGIHPSPMDLADVVTSTTHKTLRGPRGGLVLCKEALGKTLNSFVFPGIQGGPLMHIIAAKAVAFGEALRPSFKRYQEQIVKNAKALAEGLVEQGLRLCSGGTDNHLMLVDLRPKQLTGKLAEAWLGKAGMTVNKNQIPFDPQKPNISSGIRIGTPALTTRGMKEADMRQTAKFIGEALASGGEEAALAKVHAEVKAFASAFPMFADEGG
ncbi:MAG: serine hydroxymethyltransferase [Proteobacteria bacterium]|nr:serine hydroxymethyltransferase [Cystobacterineae bacterium]MCL2258302.1 serine hydroxymethyltransferase [Cystobacterineae bacterium]MCL2315076.1 serine hydroxymethyltransferase [Pseudomonadota bacterium]